MAKKNSNKTAEQIMADILTQNLQVSPELQAKRRRLLQILAEEAKSDGDSKRLRLLQKLGTEEPLDDSNDSQPRRPDHRP